MRAFALVAVFFVTSCVQAVRHAPAGNYDLAILDLRCDPCEVTAGEEVTFTAVYANHGLDVVPGRSFRVELVLGDDLALADYAPGPARPRADLKWDAGAASSWADSTIQFYRVGYTPKTTGRIAYELRLDREDHLTETDETNNVVGGTILVTSAE